MARLVPTSLFVLCIAGAVSLTLPKVAAAEDSTLCKFTRGPRSGQVQDYAPMAPIPVGSSCQDGAGSYGIVISADEPETANRTGVGPDGGTEGGSQQRRTSTVCYFTDGQQAGQSRDYAPMQALPVGTPCQDGVGSTGVVK